MPSKAARISFLILLLLLMCAFAAIIRPFILPALIAFLIAVICWPVNRAFNRWCGRRRHVAALAATLVVSLCILVPLGIMVTIATMNAVDTIGSLTSKLEAGRIAQAIDTTNHWIQAKIVDLAGEGLPEFNLRTRLLAFFSTVGTLAYQYSPQVFSATANLAAGLVLVILFIFIFFADGQKLYAVLMDLIPLAQDHKQVLAREIGSVITATFVGMIATACAQGFLIGVGFWIAGIDNALVWGILAIGVTLIPFVGGPIMYIPAAIALMISNHFYSGLFLLVYGVAIVSTIDNIIKPLALRGKVNAHPILLALGLIGGGLWLGMTGIIVGPVVVVLMLAMIQIYRKEFRDQDS
jgi:predicted PurR-regulated permease PerM